MKNSKRLTAYISATNEIAEVREITSGMKNHIKEIGTLDISSSLTITSTSTQKQFVFAIGLLNSQINASKELGASTDAYVLLKEKVITLHRLVDEITPWENFCFELIRYKQDLHSLLDNDDKFQLLEYPVKK